MLSRTADSLYWLSRYVERADYLARVLDTATRLSSLPAAYAGTGNEWESALITAGCLEAFEEVYDVPTAETVTEFLVSSNRNPSSIRRCLEIARFNARAVRTALTAEMWETINGAWLELQGFKTKSLLSTDLPRFLDWVKEVSLRVDGSGHRTMLRNDAYWFSRLGIYIERAESTARILDVKYHFLLPDQSPVGGGLDYTQWTAILRAVSAATSYHWVYRESLKPWLVADLLILKEQMPRSLAACYGNIVANLDRLAEAYGRKGPSQRLARTIQTRLVNNRIENIFQAGLHEFVSDFIRDNAAVGDAIGKQYLA
ncbi:MAG: alpha-E domain-containing protein [Rhodospirillaceae bacterium]|nr:MAG: alpha-E domain-containing protein [Rhodospirillaceae bacterium]